MSDAVTLQQVQDAGGAIDTPDGRISMNAKGTGLGCDPLGSDIQGPQIESAIVTDEGLHIKGRYRNWGKQEKGTIVQFMDITLDEVVPLEHGARLIMMESARILKAGEVDTFSMMPRPKGERKGRPAKPRAIQIECPDDKVLLKGVKRLAALKLTNFGGVECTSPEAIRKAWPTLIEKQMAIGFVEAFCQ